MRRQAGTIRTINIGVTTAIEVDVDDPQNEHSNKCGGNAFHKLLTMKTRQGFRDCDPFPREVRQHQGQDSERVCAGPDTPEQTFQSSTGHSAMMLPATTHRFEIVPSGTA